MLDDVGAVNLIDLEAFASGFPPGLPDPPEDDLGLIAGANCLCLMAKDFGRSRPFPSFCRS
jgi:hypothetical protein